VTLFDTQHIQATMVEQGFDGTASLGNLLAPENTLIFYRNTTKVYTIAVTYDTGKPVDLTGGSLVFSVKSEMSDERPVLYKNSASSADLVIAAGRGGLGTLLIRPNDTKRLPIKEYWYDLWVTLASGAQTPVIGPSVLDLRGAIGSI